MSVNNTRFGAIHGLRGIAALGVVLHHFEGPLRSELDRLLPDIINVMFYYGYLGVPVFFVISGFVISHSTSAARVNSKYVGNFILRRSIRLDLTYWASILLALILLAVKNRMLNADESAPTFSEILLHMFYLQDLMNVDPVISVVYWTLCLEVQFYLFYIFSLWFTQRVGGRKDQSLNMLIIMTLGVYSILLDIGPAKIDINGLFISNWHYFLMGVLVSRATSGAKFGCQIFILWIILEITFLAIFELKPYVIAGVCCSAGIFFMWKLKLLDRLFTGKLLTYLGTISYTIYLVHPDIGWKVISFGKLVLGDSIQPWHGGLLLLAGVMASVLVAHIFHVAFEKPTQKIASRLKSESLRTVLFDMFRTSKSSKEDAQKRASS